MIDQRFSVQRFEACHAGGEAAAELTHALRLAIARELESDLRAAGARIAERLRQLGHQVAELTHEVDPEGMASVTFADGTIDGGLRFNLDLVVSAEVVRVADEPYDDEVSGLFSG